MKTKKLQTTIDNALQVYARKIYQIILNTNDEIEFKYSMKEAKNLLELDLDFGCLDVLVACKGGKNQQKKFNL
jgi:hypothetical protein